MIRAFATTTLRHTLDLTGLWQMETAGKREAAWVPGCRETMPGYENYRGLSTYTRQIACGGERAVHLRRGEPYGPGVPG